MHTLTPEQRRVLAKLSTTPGKLRGVRVFPHAHHFELTDGSWSSGSSVSAKTIDVLITEKLIEPAKVESQGDLIHYRVTPAGREAVKKKPPAASDQLSIPD